MPGADEKISALPAGAALAGTDVTAIVQGVDTVQTTLAAMSSFVRAAVVPIAAAEVTGTAVITTDGRLTNSRTPTAHAASHAALGTDPVTLSESQITGLVGDLSTLTTSIASVDVGAEHVANKNAAGGYAGLSGATKIAGAQQTYGTATNTACAGDDSRVVAAAALMTIVTADTGNSRVGINQAVPTTALDVQSTATVETITRQVAGNGANANAMLLQRDNAFGGGAPTNSDAVGFSFRLKQTDGTYALVAALQGIITDITNGVATGDLQVLAKASGAPGAVFAREVARFTSGGAFSLKGSGNPQGVVAATIGSFFADASTGYLYYKAGGGSTAYGWYYVPLMGAGFTAQGPIVFNATYNAGGAGGNAPAGGNTFGPFGLDASIDITTSGVTTGSRAVASSKTYAGLTSAATSGTNMYITTIQSANWLVLDDDIDLSVDMFTGSDITSIRYWFGISSAAISDTATLGSAANGFIGFRYSTAEVDGGWVGVTQKNGGANQTVSATVAAIVLSTKYRLRVRFVRQGTPTVYFSVNDGTEIAVTTNIPPTGNGYFLTLGITTRANSARSFFWRSMGATIGS